jgi:hypothetical protein
MKSAMPVGTIGVDASCVHAAKVEGGCDGEGAGVGVPDGVGVGARVGVVEADGDAVSEALSPGDSITTATALELGSGDR